MALPHLLVEFLLLEEEEEQQETHLLKMLPSVVQEVAVEV